MICSKRTGGYFCLAAVRVWTEPPSSCSEVWRLISVKQINKLWPLPLLWVEETLFISCQGRNEGTEAGGVGWGGRAREEDGEDERD